MKKIIWSVFLITCSFGVFAQSRQSVTFDPAAVMPEDEKGEVVFIRNTGFAGSAIAMRAFLDENLVCRINNNRFSKHAVKPGKHQFAVQYYGKKLKSKTAEVDINVEAGEKKYVLLVQHYGWIVNKVFAVEISEASAKMLLGGMKENGK
jgi:hypothetical protein